MNLIALLFLSTIKSEKKVSQYSSQTGNGDQDWQQFSPKGASMGIIKQTKSKAEGDEEGEGQTVEHAEKTKADVKYWSVILKIAIQFPIHPYSNLNQLPSFPYCNSWFIVYLKFEDLIQFCNILNQYHPFH